MIFVTNTNDFVHVDRYDGVDYQFEPNVAVPIDEGAAAHLFGYGNANKNDTLTRLGWTFKYDEEEGKIVATNDGVDKLKRFIFSRGSFVKQPDEPADLQPDLLASDAA
jgi:hypothetical protein